MCRLRGEWGDASGGGDSSKVIERSERGVSNPNLIPKPIPNPTSNHIPNLMPKPRLQTAYLLE